MAEEIPWSIAEGKKENGKPYVLRFLEFYPSEKEQAKFKFLIEITWEYEEENPSGMPNEETFDLMNYFEDVLDEEIISSDSSILVLSLTGDEQKLWLIYSENPDLFMEQLNSVMKNQAILPIQIEVFQDEEWNGYKELVGLTE